MSIQHDANELKLWIENDERLNDRLIACQKNLFLKRFNGTYIHAKAWKLYKYLCADAHRHYEKQTDLRLAIECREICARKLADDYRPIENSTELESKCADYYKSAVDRGGHDGPVNAWVFSDGEIYATDWDCLAQAIAVWNPQKGLRRINRNLKLVSLSF